MARTVSDLIVETLQSAGVERIWGVTGDSLNGLSDSLRRHETSPGCTSATKRRRRSRRARRGADRAARGLRGQLRSRNLHLINGLFDCHRSHVPVLAIAAHIPSSEIGLGYFQETHPQELFRECSDYVELVTNPRQLPGRPEPSMNTALGKRGVAVIVLPGDVALAERPRRPARFTSRSRPASCRRTRPRSPRRDARRGRAGDAPLRARAAPARTRR